MGARAVTSPRGRPFFISVLFLSFILFIVFFFVIIIIPLYSFFIHNIV